MSSVPADVDGGHRWHGCERSGREITAAMVAARSARFDYYTLELMTIDLLMMCPALYIARRNSSI